MVQSQFALSWESFKANICNSFSALQQNGEFVDMTLAADGHFVKVHQVLMAMVSPYLKELITSAPCPHPVIFLNNVSYRTLTCLLEYVYTGEVMVPSENLMSFVDTAKALHIKGLENLNNVGAETTYRVMDNITNSDDNSIHMTGIKKVTIPAEEKSEVIGLPAAARKVTLKYKKPRKGTPIPNETQNISMESSQENMDYSDMMDTNDMHNDSDDAYEPRVSSQQKDVGTAKSTNLQFTVSIRGSLQIILNRYIYNLHSTTHRKGVRRWRCVDYRNNRCMAFVVTKGNVVLNRANLHNHAFHDQKILQKIEKKAVFSALDDVQMFTEKEQRAERETTSTTEHEDFVTVEYPSEC